MTTKYTIGEIQMIPVDLIDVLNPRERNAKTFERAPNAVLHTQDLPEVIW